MIRPGRYFTRDGRTVTIDRVGALLANGRLPGIDGATSSKEVWRVSDGRYNVHGDHEHRWDLVSRIATTLKEVVG